MYSKKRVLKDLCDLYYAKGLHGGRWEDERYMDESAEIYLATMIMFAEEYDVVYDKNIENYVQDKEYEAECYTKENMASEIFELVENKLVNILDCY